MIITKSWKYLAWGALLALGSRVEANCGETWFYNGQPGEGAQLVENSQTWPELPEMQTNWGERDGMRPPYIRFSGQKSTRGNWSGAMKFAALPVSWVRGSLRLQVWVSQASALRVWVEGKEGKSKEAVRVLAGSRTHNLVYSLEELGLPPEFTVLRIGLGLDDVPAWSYRTVFFDNLRMDCVRPEKKVDEVDITTDLQVTTAVDLTKLRSSYPWVSVIPSAAMRPVEGKSLPVPYPSRHGRENSIDLIEDDFLGGASIFLDEAEDASVQQLLTIASTEGTAPLLWRRITHALVRGISADSSMPNPREIFHRAFQFAQTRSFLQMPLLLADIRYRDAENKLENRVVQATLPLTKLPRGEFLMSFDPYFVVTNHGEPLGVIHLSGCGQVTQSLRPGEQIQLQLPGAQPCPLQIRYQVGEKNFYSTTYLEVQ